MQEFFISSPMSGAWLISFDWLKRKLCHLMWQRPNYESLQGERSSEVNELMKYSKVFSPMCVQWPPLIPPPSSQSKSQWMQGQPSRGCRGDELNIWVTCFGQWTKSKDVSHCIAPLNTKMDPKEKTQQSLCQSWRGRLKWWLISYFRLFPQVQSRCRLTVDAGREMTMGKLLKAFGVPAPTDRTCRV